MKEFILYFKLLNFGVDENDELCDLGMTLSLGEQKEDINYNDVAAALNMDVLLEMTGLKGIVDINGIEIMTPEEYKKEFGGEEECE